MSDTLSIHKQLGLTMLTALAPTVVLAFDPSFVHARVLDPNVPAHASEYLNGVGFLTPWLITEIPTRLRNVSLVDRVFPGQLLRLYVTSFILVAVLWVFVRFLGKAFSFIRSRS